MPDLIANASADEASSGVVVSGPVLVTVTGKNPFGRVRITANIGGGEATAYIHSAGDPTSLARLEFTSGVTMKAYLENTQGGASGVYVTYIPIV